MFDIDRISIEQQNEILLETRWVIVNELGKRKVSGAVNYLISILAQDENGVIREEAARALCNFDNGAAVESLLETLKNEPLAEIRCAVAEGLVNFKGAEIVCALIDALQDKDCRVQRSAARTLGIIGDSRAIEPLVRALATGARFAQEEVLRSLKAFGGLAFSALLRRLEVARAAHRRRIAAALSSLGADYVGQLIEALESPSASVREGVIMALGAVGDARAVRPLIAAARGERLKVVRAAVVSLGYYDTEASLKTLIEAASHPDAGIRASAAKALCRTGNARAVEPLISLLEDQSPLVARSAESSLGRMGALPVESLISKLNDEREWMRASVIRALTLTGNSATDLLIKALKDGDWRVRAGAARALGRI
jgi:HEAT repeat protein